MIPLFKWPSSKCLSPSHYIELNKLLLLWFRLPSKSLADDDDNDELILLLIKFLYHSDYEERDIDWDGDNEYEGLLIFSYWFYILVFDGAWI